MAKQSKSTMANSLKLQHEIRKEQLIDQQRQEDGFAARMRAMLQNQSDKEHARSLKSRETKREVAKVQQEQMRSLKEDKIQKFTKQQLQDLADCTKNVLEAELKEIRKSNLRTIWARDARITQEEQMRQREETYLDQKTKDRDIDQTFLRNVGYKAQSSTRATLEPQGTIFDNIYKAKPPKARLQSQTVMEQKRQLEELRKAAENKNDDRRSLLELNVLMRSQDH